MLGRTVHSRSEPAGGVESRKARKDCSQSLGALKGPPSAPQASYIRPPRVAGGDRGTRCEPRGLTHPGPLRPGWKTRGVKVIGFGAGERSSFSS